MIGIKWIDALLTIGLIVLCYRVQNTWAEPIIYISIIINMIQMSNKYDKI